MSVVPGGSLAEKQFKPDRWLFLITLVLLSFGVVMVFDASYPHAIALHDDKAYFFKRQLLWSAIGLVGLFLASKVQYWKWKALGVPAIVTVLALLVAVRLPHIGHGGRGPSAGSGTARSAFSLRNWQSSESCCFWREYLRRDRARSTTSGAGSCPSSRLSVRRSCWWSGSQTLARRSRCC